MYIAFFIHSIVFVFRNEEKIVALLIYSSFKRVATRMLRRNLVFTFSGSQFSQTERKLGVNTVSLCIQYSIRAQFGNWNDCDVTRVVATETYGTNIHSCFLLRFTAVALFSVIDRVNVIAHQHTKSY